MTKHENIKAGETPTMRIWDALSKTDPAQTKGFSRAGGFKGTAVKPMWVIKRLTEQFGPCGVGWGIGRPQFEVVHGGPGEALVYCTVSCWHGNPDNELYGVGGDRVATMRKSGEPFFDDEAFKKAFTDAVNNAFKFIGVAADIHMGLFDDSKYVAEVGREFEAAQADTRVPGIHKIKQRLNKLMLDGDKETDLEKFNALVHDCKAELTAIRDAKHQYWTGDGEDSEGFAAWIKRRREELSGSVGFMFLMSLVEECDTQAALQNLVAQHGDAVDALDGAEARRFQARFDEREAGLSALDKVTAGA
jgi:hypothetical protein